MRILLTNDDGISAPGLAAIADVLVGIGDLVVVAPDRPRSAASSAITLYEPLIVRRSDRNGVRSYSVSGTPADAAKLALRELLDETPDFVVSGINFGLNTGSNILYSGTVAAAMEATILGIPAAAISYTGYEVEHMSTYGPLIAELIGSILAREDFPPGTILNVNLPDIPADDAKGVEVTSLGRRVYHDSVTRHLDPRGREYLWIGGGRSEWHGGEESDFRVVDAGYVSVTPLHLDLTDFDLIDQVRSWTLGS